ncbi:MAG: hypothetical protein O3A20_04325 [Planctomycetota bacterium]|nr:hypothetical protein [Planctomycetota bacterium]
MLAELILLAHWQESAEAAPPPPPEIARLKAIERILFTIQEEYAEAALFPAFAPDGSRAAVAVYSVAGRALILLDGEATETHHQVRIPRFSADGKHVAWAWGDRGKKDRDEWELMLDGKRVKKADWIGDPCFAPVGDDYAVWTGKDVTVDSLGGHEGGEYTCSWGNKKAGGYTEPPWREPQWSTNGKHLGSLAQKPSRFMAVVDGKEYGPYDFASGFTWSPDGKIAAWAAMEDWGEMRIFTPKKSYGDGYESVGAPALGSDGSMAYLARIRGRTALIFNATVVPGFYDGMGTPSISPDGKRVVVAANDGAEEASSDWYLDNAWMDGALGINEDEKALADAGSKCFMVVDAYKLGGDWWRVVRPFFSPDSQHVAARARSAEGWQVLLDEGVGPVYDEVHALRFSADGKLLEFGARRGRDLLWVQLPVE